MQPCEFCIGIFGALHYICGVEKSEINPQPQEIHMFEVLKARVSNWKRYNRTINELNALSNRELEDLGIMRADINRIAREAVRT
jgi:uncharacterized protein YjiS (DUF1127 family)